MNEYIKYVYCIYIVSGDPRRQTVPKFRIPFHWLAIRRYTPCCAHSYQCSTVEISMNVYRYYTGHSRRSGCIKPVSILLTDVSDSTVYVYHQRSLLMVDLEQTNKQTDRQMACSYLSHIRILNTTDYTTTSSTTAQARGCCWRSILRRSKASRTL